MNFSNTTKTTVNENFKSSEFDFLVDPCNNLKKIPERRNLSAKSNGTSREKNDVRTVQIREESDDDQTVEKRKYSDHYLHYLYFLQMLKEEKFPFYSENNRPNGLLAIESTEQAEQKGKI